MRISAKLKTQCTWLCFLLEPLCFCCRPGRCPCQLHFQAQICNLNLRAPHTKKLMLRADRIAHKTQWGAWLHNAH